MCDCLLPHISVPTKAILIKFGLETAVALNYQTTFNLTSCISVSVEDMIAAPFETCSDSFYFVDNHLVMHNKADYAYNGGINN